MSELRWNPLLGEWVPTATKRHERPFLPSNGRCPFPSCRDNSTSEVSENADDIVVFENHFPSFSPSPEAPAVEGSDLYQVRPGQGICEVVLYTSRHNSTLAREPVEQIEKLVRAWTNRFLELGALSFVDYVFIFENKGEAVGVTLHHPHGQIYGYSFTPPRVARELQQSLAHHTHTGSCLVCDIIAEERREGLRIIAVNKSFVAYIPFFARYAFEVHISSLRHLQALTDLDRTEQKDLAEMLKTVLAAFDSLFDLPFPYIMAMHQRPTDGGCYDYYHFHIEFYPPLRTATKLRYLAGSESGAGVFINETLAEQKAAELRAHVTLPHRPDSLPRDG